MMNSVKRVLFATQWWQNDLLRGVARHAADHGWHLNLQMLVTGILPSHWSGDGIITTLGGTRESEQNFYRQTTRPAVSLSLNHPDIDIPRVGIDNDMAGRLAADHFLDRGFQHFAFYNRTRSHVSVLRFQAYAHYVAEHGYRVEHLLHDEDNILLGESWDERQMRLRQLLVSLPKPLAVFAHDDSSGVEIIEACQQEAIEVPEKVAVLGMLDIDLFRDSTQIPLSSITVDFDAYTKAACDLLARMMAGEPAPKPPILFPPAGIAVRRSSDTIAARSDAGLKAIRFMQAHYAESIGVNDVARAVGMSHTQFYQVFKGDLDQSPHAVLTRIRLDHAKRMLVETKLKLEAVAEACGFVDRINLHRNFKRHVGESPAAYRKQAHRIG